MTDCKLIIFDVDGTLCDRDSTALYPEVTAWLAAHPEQQVAIATNQGGVGLRYWMESGGFGEPGKYPTEEQVWERLDAILDQFPDGGHFPSVQVCFAYQSRKGDWSPVPAGRHGVKEWSSDCRKPAPGMLLNAMRAWGVTSGETLMVGDSADDQLAADAAGCAFAWAWEFFGREKPSED